MTASQCHSQYLKKSWKPKKMSYVILSPQTNEAMMLTEAMKYCVGDDPRTKYDTGNDLIDMLPSRKFYIDVDSATVMKTKWLIPERLLECLSVLRDLGDVTTHRKKMMWWCSILLHIITGERPIYFAVTTGDEAYLGLKSTFSWRVLLTALCLLKQAKAKRLRAEGLTPTWCMIT